MSDLLKQARSRGVKFEVHVFRWEGGWRIEISDPIRGRGPVSAFAAVEAYDLDTAMKMAVPYLACIAEPNPLADFLTTERDVELDTYTAARADELRSAASGSKDSP